MSAYPSSADVPTWTPPTDPPIREEALGVPPPVTYYPPLTEAEFAEGAYGPFRGIPLVEDENASYVFAWGHHDKATYAAAVNEYDYANAGGEYEYNEAHVEHTLAVTTRPGEEWVISWDPETVEASDQPSFPVTVVSR